MLLTPVHERKINTIKHKQFLSIILSSINSKIMRKDNTNSDKFRIFPSCKFTFAQNDSYLPQFDSFQLYLA